MDGWVVVLPSQEGLVQRPESPVMVFTVDVKPVSPLLLLDLILLPHHILSRGFSGTGGTRIWFL